ncbi:LPD7 domain-containing protein [Mesorhizobium sp. BR1-1-14]|uniref:LPD7 domain-containing protein n=1 Tax=Mesorhizobium sp. BR1-1-14 TaxID=2876655 RepID=UPI001CD132F3|nr:LPD7 domain-containing protein [Mesorhizobium sp. BR1-1-14]MBZ9960618.1 hypothetical protein [Mesorhizobium sp. BR1-1-14]
MDVHDTPASDGGRNVNVHGLVTLREIDGDSFAARKTRAWNDAFRERNGRSVREQFAERLTEFCRQHGIDYQGDARANAERSLPDPEPNLPKWNFEVFARAQEMPEALAALHDHRRRRREWEAAKAAENEAALDLSRMEEQLRTQRQRRITPAGDSQRSSSKRDRRAAILRTWHGNGWVDVSTIPAIACVRFDRKRDLLWIDLTDGTTLIDRGDAITMRGPVTWTAALESAAAAERHGWVSVQIYGDQAYKDAVAIACMLCGIEVTNHHLSPKAQAALDRLRAQRPDRSDKSNDLRSAGTGAEGASGFPVLPEAVSERSSRDIHRQFTKRAFVKDAPPVADPDAENPAPVLKPRYRKPTPRQRDSGLNGVA